MYIENQGLFIDIRIFMLMLKMIFVPESMEGSAEKKTEELKNVIDKCEEFSERKCG